MNFRLLLVFLRVLLRLYTMRGTFNKTFTVRYGPRSLAGPPGVTYGVEIACRRVPQTRIFQHQFDFSLSGFWVTEDTVRLNTPFVSSPYLGAFFTDQYAADEVAFSDNPGVWYSVCREEEVHPYVGADYWRYLLVPVASFATPPWLPPTSPPPPPDPPGPPVVPPGGGCAEAAALAGVGEYVLSAAASDEPGWYSISLEKGRLIRIEILSSDAEYLFITIRRPPDGLGCCDAVELDTITFPSYPSFEFTMEGEEETFATICLQVLRTGGDDPPWDGLVRISYL